VRAAGAGGASGVAGGPAGAAGGGAAAWRRPLEIAIAEPAAPAPSAASIQPGPLRSIPSAESSDGVPGTGVGERQRRNDQEHLVLSCGGLEALVPNRGAKRCDHYRRQAGRGQRRGETKRD
jgi:hypothetical protein